jgi:hypothetical protein
LLIRIEKRPGGHFLDGKRHSRDGNNVAREDGFEHRWGAIGGLLLVIAIAEIIEFN